MDEDNEQKEQTITIKTGKITRLYVVMCNECFGTLTNAVPAQEIMERDLLLSGWLHDRDGIWHCPDCASGLS